ncbi:hypothetical protein V3C99_001360 [Haemonchus contortus]|uniref:Uncharacterized protein n=1 Tax=Haemonchus contortus TaxID=6289 RepID=A0A7I4YCL8_HAECO
MVTAEKEVKSNRREMEAAEVLKKSVQAMQDQLQVLKMLPSKTEEEARLDKLQPPQETDDQHFDRYFESRAVIRHRSARRSRQGRECYPKVDPLWTNLAAREPALRKPSRPLIGERQKN